MKNSADSFKKHLSSPKQIYNFSKNGLKVRVKFSDKPDAPTIEEALAKIASGRLN